MKNKKIQVRVQHGANNTPQYVSIEPSGRRGVYKVYSETTYKANPEQFEIVKESAKPSGRVLAHEMEPLGKIVVTPLHPALAELNEIIATLTPLRPNRTAQQIEAEAQKMCDDKQRLKESWEKRGLTPEAAAVAARQQIAMAPPASDLEFWSKFKF